MEDASTLVKPKRGRKSKKDLLIALNMNPLESANALENYNVQIKVDEKYNEFVNENIQLNVTDENIVVKQNIVNIEDNKPISKKRGRKPKGGKIIDQITLSNNKKNIKPNIILHLKCWLKDLHDSGLNDIESYHFSTNKDLTYEVIKNESINNLSYKNNSHNEKIKELDEDDESNKNIWKKIKQLEYNLHINNTGDKKSACFWCTYDFDNPPIYIPKFFIKNSYHVYGCFCSPECATAFLMEECIDSSTKFERYHFINHLYGKIYNYTKNIKPAPNPYYMLDKYYGNLSIQEYRSLFKNERLFLIVDKPLTRVLPELHEDNDDFILSNKIIPSNNYQIKPKIQRKATNKTSILNENFGIIY
jgi:hypothetical protein